MDTRFKEGSSKRAQSKDQSKEAGIVDAPAPEGKAFSSQIKKMSKKPLKYNPEEVMVIAVEMYQEQFDFAIEVAKEALGKFKKEEEPAMAKFVASKFNERFGLPWMSVVGDSYGLVVSHKGNFAHFHVGPKDFVIYKA